MERWLLLFLTVLTPLVVGFPPGTQPARRSSGLGAPCAYDADCASTLTCTEDAALAGQCSAVCRSDDSCQSRFGRQARCIGVDQCVRTCNDEISCPEGTACNSYGWCEAVTDTGRASRLWFGCDASDAI